MENKEITIHIYDSKGEVAKESTARPFDLRFGSIRKMMQLLKIESITDTYEMMKTVLDVWEELTGILGECFPDITPDEWDGVKVNELMPVIVQIMRAAFSEMLTIPTDKKNG